VNIAQPTYVKCPKINGELEVLLCVRNREMAKDGVEFFKEFCGKCPKFLNSKFNVGSSGKFGIKLGEPHSTVGGHQ